MNTSPVAFLCGLPPRTNRRTSRPMTTVVVQDVSSPTGLANGAPAEHPSTAPDAGKDETAEAAPAAVPRPTREQRRATARAAKAAAPPAPAPTAPTAPTAPAVLSPSDDEARSVLDRMAASAIQAAKDEAAAKAFARSRLSVLETERATWRALLGLDAAHDEDGPGDQDEADTKAARPMLAVNGGRVAGPRRGGILRGAAAKPAAATRATAKSGAAKAKPAKAGRLARRSTADLKAQLDAIVKAVKAAGAEGLRAEHIRAKLMLDRRELPRLLRMGRTSKRLKVVGKKRGACYFAR
jgi:hypothetical protein